MKFKQALNFIRKGINAISVESLDEMEKYLERKMQKVRTIKRLQKNILATATLLSELIDEISKEISNDDTKVFVEKKTEQEKDKELFEVIVKNQKTALRENVINFVKRFENGITIKLLAQEFELAPTKMERFVRTLSDIEYIGNGLWKLKNKSNVLEGSVVK